MLQYSFCFMLWFFWPQGKQDRLSSRPGIESVPYASEGQVLTTGLLRKSHGICISWIRTHTLWKYTFNKAPGVATSLKYDGQGCTGPSHQGKASREPLQDGPRLPRGHLTKVRSAKSLCRMVHIFPGGISPRWGQPRASAEWSTPSLGEAILRVKPGARGSPFLQMIRIRAPPWVRSSVWYKPGTSNHSLYELHTPGKEL